MQIQIRFQIIKSPKS